MTMSVLISGANRGLGLEYTRQYLQQGWRVLACCRNPDRASDLQALTQQYSSQLAVYRLDVAQFDSVQALAEKLHNAPIDLLINNAGIYLDHASSISDLQFYEDWALTFRVNVMAPYQMTMALLPNLKQGQKKLVVHMSSRMGSLADNTSGGSFQYRSSKAALNMVMRSLVFELAPYGISTVVLHPGWVLTDMGGANALISAQQSITGLRQVIESLTMAQSGQFITYDGQIVPW